MELIGSNHIVLKRNLIRNIPKGRMMKTNDLYGIIDYLCSKENTFMNGSTIILDGGLLILVIIEF